MQERVIRINLKRHKGGKLFMAVSDDLRGLVVHGRSIDEVNAKIPGIIRDLLEADSIEVSPYGQIW